MADFTHIDQMLNSSLTHDTVYTVAGYYEANDWGNVGGGTEAGNEVPFRYDSGSSTPANHGTVLTPLQGGRLLMHFDTYSPTEFSVLQFGCLGNNSTTNPTGGGSSASNAVRMNSCLEAAMNEPASAVKKVYIPIGIYQLKDSLMVDGAHSGIETYGELAETTTTKEFGASFTANIENGSNVITNISDVSRVHYKMRLQGAGLQAGTRVLMVSGNSALIDRPATATQTGVSIVEIFRVIVEESSSILKMADSGWVGPKTGTVALLRTAPLQPIITNDIYIHHLGLDGNRYVFEYEQPRSFRIEHRERIDVGVKFRLEDIIAYHSGGSCSSRGNNMILKNILIYDGYRHGISGRPGSYEDVGESATCTFENIEVYDVAEQFGFYGLDWSLNSRTKNYNIYCHNSQHLGAAGMKSPNPAYIEMVDVSLANNGSYGFRFQETVTDGVREVYFDNIVAENNGRNGYNLHYGTVRKIGRVIVRNNNWDTETHGGQWNITTTGYDIGVLINKDYNGGQTASMRLFDSNVAYLESTDNQAYGADINGSSVVRSGSVKNNYRYGFRIRDGSTLRVYHTHFSGQTAIINLGTIYYGKLTGASLPDDATHIPVSDTFTIPTLSSPANNAEDQELDVTLSWVEIGDATSYVVQVSDDDFETILFAKEVETNSVELKDFAGVGVLEANKTYKWRVYALKESGDVSGWEFSDWSDVGAFSTGEIDLESPSLISPSDNATGIDTNPKLRWNTVAGATHYGVKVSKNADLSTPVVDEANVGDVDEYQLSNLEHNTTYYWQVTAHDGVNSADSDIRNFETAGVELTAPELLSPSNGASNQSINTLLQWTKGANATHHGLVVSNNSDLSLPVIDDGNIGDGNIEEYQLSNLDYNTIYYWQVTAYNNSDPNDVKSESSNIRSFTTQGAIQILEPELIPEQLGDWTVEGETDGGAALRDVSDEKFITTNTVGGNAYVTKLVKRGGGTVDTPTQKDGWKFGKIRAKLEGGGIKIIIKLIEDWGGVGEQEIAVREITEETNFAEFDLTLTVAEADNVSDANNLYRSYQLVSVV